MMAEVLLANRCSIDDADNLRKIERRCKARNRSYKKEGYQKMSKNKLPIFICLIGLGCIFSNVVHAVDNELVIHADQGEHEISRYIYGHFIEHMGRCIYDGIWVGEDSPIPNTRGIRNDVVKALKHIKVPIVRWPGGCFADTYHWKDGIGPRQDRPITINRPKKDFRENNHFGTHEFMDFCEQVGCEPYICGNVGSGTVEELSEWIEYMTFGGSSTMADLRRKNGRDKPWKVKYWAVGNENEGCGGSMPPEYYSYLYRRFQTYMNSYSGNDLYKVACGPVNLDYHWTEIVMKIAGEHMDGLALHNYSWSGERTQTAVSFGEDDWFFLLRRTYRMEEHIEKVIGIMDKYDPEESVALIVDEWGACHEERDPSQDPSDDFQQNTCLLYTSPSPRDRTRSRMPSSA